MDFLSFAILDSQFKSNDKLTVPSSLIPGTAGVAGVAAGVAWNKMTKNVSIDF